MGGEFDLSGHCEFVGGADLDLGRSEKAQVIVHSPRALGIDPVPANGIPLAGPQAGYPISKRLSVTGSDSRPVGINGDWATTVTTMHGLKRLASPGWLIGLLAVLAFAYACFTILAPWQLNKSEQLDARNAKLSESVRAEPVPFSEIVTSASVFSEQEWRKVTVTGTWVPGAEVLLRLRSVDSTPVYQALTVFRIDSGPEILINRGWIPVGENNAVPALSTAPSEPVSLTARLRSGEAGSADLMTLFDRRMVRTIDLPSLATDLGEPIVAAGYLQLAPEQPGALNPTPIPDVENGPYLSYGLQWLSFGILAPLALGYFAWSEYQRRRSNESADSASNAHPALPEMAATGAEFARYGDRFDAERRRARRRGDRLG